MGAIDGGFLLVLDGGVAGGGGNGGRRWLVAVPDGGSWRCSVPLPFRCLQIILAVDTGRSRFSPRRSLCAVFLETDANENEADSEHIEVKQSEQRTY